MPISLHNLAHEQFDGHVIVEDSWNTYVNIATVVLLDLSETINSVKYGNQDATTNCQHCSEEYIL